MKKTEQPKEPGGGRASRRDLRALVRTLWELIDKVESLDSAILALGERIDELINLR